MYVLWQELTYWRRISHKLQKSSEYDSDADTYELHIIKGELRLIVLMNTNVCVAC